MANLEKIVSYAQLSGGKKELASAIGLEAYKKLVQNYGGSYIYINKADSVVRNERNREICKKFNGSNYCQLAQEYHLSENRIRAILRQKHFI